MLTLTPVQVQYVKCIVLHNIVIASNYGYLFVSLVVSIMLIGQAWNHWSFCH